MPKDFEYQVIEKCGIIGQSGDFTKEVRIISYNGGPPRVDIRSWKHRGEKEFIGKGISFSPSEAARLWGILREVDL